MHCVAFLDSVLADCAILPGCDEESFAGATRALSDETCHRLLHDSCDRDLVASFRALASCFIRDDAAAMSAWLPMPVEDYCLTVASMGTDAEGLAIRALSEALSIRLRIVYLHRDRDLGYYSYPVDNDEPCHVHLLLSPGHYDLLYPALPTAWGGSASLLTPVEASAAVAPTPRALRLIRESRVQIRTPRSRRLPLLAGVSCSQSAPSSFRMHGIQVGSSVIHNWAQFTISSVPFSMGCSYKRFLSRPLSEGWRSVA